jgi:hypothetical protein
MKFNDISISDGRDFEAYGDERMNLMGATQD